MTEAETETDSSISQTTGHLLVSIGFLLSFFLEQILFKHKHSHSHGVTTTETHHHHHHHHNPESLGQIEIPKKIYEPMLPDEDPEAPNNFPAFELDDLGETITELTETKELELGEKVTWNERIMRDIKKDVKGIKKWPFILFSVLALESSLTGAALGFQTESSGVGILLLAIGSHIWAECFALSCFIFSRGFSIFTTQVSITIFSFITPAFIAVGVLSEDAVNDQLIADISSVLISIASGTFVFVAIVEIMGEEF
eukprot:CAMPEP_0174268166 /NCGR_PEP_ID=MMETSP0439-20130205/36423_1 /TAXON_ID=0 /ORGANISM="Stereomyxa ramosa, Strain Chinc5" /LENGTH=254 /DNA_ID=CAMNT_0015356163 /DNA_START=173 /DNA_END=934 /DNA_ORIENTATION=-